MAEEPDDHWLNHRDEEERDPFRRLVQLARCSAPIADDVAASLLASIDDVNARDSTGDMNWGRERRYGLLHYACLHCHVGLVKRLLEAGANPNLLAHNFSTPLATVLLTSANTQTPEAREAVVDLLSAWGAEPAPALALFVRAGQIQSAFALRKLAAIGCRISPQDMEDVAWFNSTITEDIQRQWHELDARMNAPDFHISQLNVADLCLLANQSREQEVLDPALWQGYEATRQNLLTQLPPWLASDYLKCHAEHADVADAEQPDSRIARGLAQGSLWTQEARGR